jgi:hypothetical protein
MTSVPSPLRPLNGNEMICIPAEIPRELCEIDDELKAIYHSNNSVCIWVFNSTEDRNSFVSRSIGMNKHERSALYDESFR